ncbi:MAG: hypothetical protein VXZ82_13495 [Planctomycetota bacterium]|nr:hypothetical protein [Planctomycetota bacterium]
MNKNNVAAEGIEWLSRTITILIVMVGPGLLGQWLDRRLRTNYLALVGLGVGVTLGTYILILLAKRLTPPARGAPLSDEQEEVESESSD